MAPIINPIQNENSLTRNNIIPKRMINKRKFENNNETSNNNRMNFISLEQIKNKQNRIIKRKRDINNLIIGQKLPINRIIETLNKEKLQLLINKLINEKPEINNLILNLSPVIEPNDALNQLNEKLEIILKNLPYKVEINSDYSFLRVKYFVNDFFQSLSEFSLNYLPPIENNLIISINFLKKFLIEIFHKLPNFNTVEFKYFYNLTIDKFNLILENSINQFLTEKKQNLLLIINENWLDEFKLINKLNNNNFIKIENLIENEINDYNNSSSIILNDNQPVNLVQKENKLQGLDSLLNFAYQTNTVDNI
ncbi:Sts1 protein [Pichia kluyveri]|uniref:Tethering factor for nuclear proteasome STS1 n=1 Tax=Pichia kluyveri TaxID=36015 RepID=A0AAV5QXD4_PICKL|nr:Sts1 protein [Pichia kluyveri]